MSKARTTCSGTNPQRVKQGLKQRFQSLLERDFDHLLFAHGDPVVGNGKAALRDFAMAPPDTSATAR